MQLAIVLSGDLTKEEEGFLKNQLKEKEEKTKRLQKQNEESQRKVQALEEAFNEIKQVTGASTLDIMIEKFANQKTNKKNLEKEVKDAEKKLNDAKKEFNTIEQYYQELKSSGLGNTEISREMTQQREEVLCMMVLYGTVYDGTVYDGTIWYCV
jgi:chromosome segregation ATPase